MATRKYLWAPGDSLPEIDPHSLAKHTVLGRYLRQYIRVVTANRKMDRLRLTLVDGFSGGGRYRDSTGQQHPGSPLIMLDAMAEAAATIAAENRTKPLHLDVQYYFIEENRRVFDHLRGVLIEEGHSSRVGTEITLMNATFEASVAGIVAAIRARGSSGRAIFLLDQYGYSDVLLATVRNIFSQLKKAEVLLTLATDWLIDFLSDDKAHQVALSPLGVTPAELLIHKDNPQWRQRIQLQLHQHIVRESGAAYYTPFFIVSPDAHRSYWFLHLSGHPKARDEMARLHWELQNHFAHYGSAGLHMLGYNPMNDPDVTRQPAFGFDNAARARTVAALAQDLPRFMHPFTDGVPFSELFARIANETPATSAIVKEVVLSLAQAGELEVRGAAGGAVRRKDVVSDDAIIVARRQLGLFR